VYRALDVLGRNRNEILFHVRRRLMRSHGIDLETIVMDWTSIHFEAEVSSILKYGHSRDHRPDRPQVTVGVVQDKKSSIPVGMTILPGNINDQEHFKFTYGQVREDLEVGSRVVFDAGAHGKPNVDLLVEDGMRYLSRMKLNNSDEGHILNFNEEGWVLVDAEDGVYGKRLMFPSRTKYLYFSRKLRDDIISRKRGGLERKYEEAMRLRSTIVDGRKTPKRYRSSNPFLDLRLFYQFRLYEMEREEAMERALELSLTGREGFFALISNENFSLHEALKIYREKDSVERLFNSLKNEIRIRPARCWSENGIYGAFLIAFQAQIVISFIRFRCPELKTVSTKFIMRSLMSFSLTVVFQGDGRMRRIFSNFDEINRLVLAENAVIT